MYALNHTDISTHSLRTEGMKWDINRPEWWWVDSVDVALTQQAQWVDHQLRQLQTQLEQARTRLNDPAQASNKDKWQAQIDILEAKIDQIKNGGQDMKWVERARAGGNVEQRQARAEANSMLQDLEWKGSEQTLWFRDTVIQGIMKNAPYDPRKNPLSSAILERAYGLYEILKAKGIPPNMALAIVSNGIMESKCDPSCRQNWWSAEWLFQWDGSRLATLKTRPNYLSMETQITFLLEELQNNYKDTYNKMLTASVADGTKAFTKEYEKPKNMEQKAKERAQLAQYITPLSQIW